MYREKVADSQQTDYEFKEDFLLWLEDNLKKYDKIFLVLEGWEVLKKFAEVSYYSLDLKGREQKILMLYPKEVGKRLNVVTEYGQGVNSSVMTYQQLEEAEIDVLCSLYFMYEFSDRFQIVFQNEGYGGVFCLADAGLLNDEEVVRALLY